MEASHKVDLQTKRDRLTRLTTGVTANKGTCRDRLSGSNSNSNSSISNLRHLSNNSSNRGLLHLNTFNNSINNNSRRHLNSSNNLMLGLPHSKEALVMVTEVQSVRLGRLNWVPCRSKATSRLLSHHHRLRATPLSKLLMTGTRAEA